MRATEAAGSGTGVGEREDTVKGLFLSINIYTVFTA